MGRAKLPRKSTSVDMTAMCDVAFLLLSFFILATKPKPPEVIKVSTPSSVSTATLLREGKVIVTIGKDGKVFLTFDDQDKKEQVLKTMNTQYNLQITDADVAKSKSVEAFGTPMAQLHSFLNQPASAQKPELLAGIPTLDSTNNQLNQWFAVIHSVYQRDDMMVVKGDGMAKYPVFKSVIDAFKKNDLMKFNVITNQEGVEAGTALYKENESKKAQTAK